MQKMLDELKQQFDLTVQRELTATQEVHTLRVYSAVLICLSLPGGLFARRRVGRESTTRGSRGIEPLMVLPVKLMLLQAGFKEQLGNLRAQLAAAVAKAEEADKLRYAAE